MITKHNFSCDPVPCRCQVLDKPGDEKWDLSVKRNQNISPPIPCKSPIYSISEPLSVSELASQPVLLLSEVTPKFSCKTRQQLLAVVMQSHGDAKITSKTATESVHLSFTIVTIVFELIRKSQSCKHLVNDVGNGLVLCMIIATPDAKVLVALNPRSTLSIHTLAVCCCKEVSQLQLDAPARVARETAA
jgi:hypothetical protein